MPKPTNQKAPFKLARTFFTQNLLEVDPFELRLKLFIRHHEREIPGLFEDLLDALEDQASEALKKNPLPAPFKKEYATSKVWLYEHEFYSEFADSGLTHKQANAIAALYSVRSIRREYFSFEHIRDDPKVARILVEMFVLTMAAIRGDFRILLEKSDSRRAGSKQAAAKSAETREIRTRARRDLYRHLAKEHIGRKSIRKAALGISDTIQKALSKSGSDSHTNSAIHQCRFDQVPKIGTIMAAIRDLFPQRARR